MIFAVLDTNTLASGLVGAFSPPPDVIDRWRWGQFSLVVSTPILSELERTLKKPYFSSKISSKELDDVFTLLREMAHRVEPIPPIPVVASHPADDLILATAVQAKVNYLITGDGPLQKIGEYQGVQIVSAEEFVEILDRP